MTKFVIPIEMESPVLVCGYQLKGGGYAQPHYVSHIDFAEVADIGDALSIAEKHKATVVAIVPLHDLNEVAKLLVTGAVNQLRQPAVTEPKRDVLNVASKRKKTRAIPEPTP